MSSATVDSVCFPQLREIPEEEGGEVSEWAREIWRGEYGRDGENGRGRRGKMAVRRKVEVRRKKGERNRWMVYRVSGKVLRRGADSLVRGVKIGLKPTNSLHKVILFRLRNMEGCMNT